MMPYFKVLGPLRVVSGDRDCTPTPRKIRNVLALLLLNANRVVHMDSLIEELWGDEPPRSAVTTVQTYIYHLRQLFAAEKLDGPERPLLVTRQPGYVLQIEPQQLDADVFERLVRQGRGLLGEGRCESASVVLNEALDMWTGQALVDVQGGASLQAHATHLEERRINAFELRIEADIRLGRHRELVAELRSLVHAHPLNEWFHGELIRVLSYSERRSEALQAYRSLRDILREELGVDPSPSLQKLQHQLLSVPVPERAARMPAEGQVGVR